MEKLGKEPEYTNWARIREEPEFKETLDYIFYSKVRERSGDKESGMEREREKHII